jgi:hypothetical protein
MRHDLQDEHLLAGVEDSRDKPVFIAADIEDNAVTDKTRRPKDNLDI